jgi:sugar phosphate isomerase/epimerase
MYHFKQTRDGTMLGDTRDGDLDWRAISGALHGRGYTGPALFEIPGGDDAWDRLDASSRYVRGLFAGFPAA